MLDFFFVLFLFCHFLFYCYFFLIFNFLHWFLFFFCTSFVFFSCSFVFFSYVFFKYLFHAFFLFLYFILFYNLLLFFFNLVEIYKSKFKQTTFSIPPMTITGDSRQHLYSGKKKCGFGFLYRRWFDLVWKCLVFYLQNMTWHVIIGV